MAGRSRDHRARAGRCGRQHGTAHRKYLGAAVVPQAFDKRYFTLLVMAPYSEVRDVHLYTHLLYPANASKVFLSEFTDLVTRFAEYLD
jgi:hypothetical protein